MPINQNSAIWLTGAWTYLTKDDLFKNWPRRKWIQTYEASFDFAWNKRWGIIIQIRAISPFLNEANLAITDLTGVREIDVTRRVSSGWNSLVHWRGAEAFGVRYRPSKFSQYLLSIVEDWGIGSYDEFGDSLYINNAPDVAFVFQAQWGI